MSFAILWHTDVDGARAIAERIREAVGDLKIAYPISNSGCLSVSIGVACVAPMGSEPEHLIAAADRALYGAKENGRDRVTISTEVA
jgi:diguanylate cyclase (GGDEF)-like protein